MKNKFLFEMKSRGYLHQCTDFDNLERINIGERIRDMIKIENDIEAKLLNIKKSSFVNLLNQNRSLIDENQRLKNKYEKENKERCPICLEDIDNFVVTTVCNHKFCNDCFIPWVEKEYS